MACIRWPLKVSLLAVRWRSKKKWKKNMIDLCSHRIFSIKTKGKATGESSKLALMHVHCVEQRWCCFFYQFFIVLLKIRSFFSVNFHLFRFFFRENKNTQFNDRISSSLSFFDANRCQQIARSLSCSLCAAHTLIWNSIFFRTIHLFVI